MDREPPPSPAGETLGEEAEGMLVPPGSKRMESRLSSAAALAGAEGTQAPGIFLRVNGYRWEWPCVSPDQAAVRRAPGSALSASASTLVLVSSVNFREIRPVFLLAVRRPSNLGVSAFPVSRGPRAWAAASRQVCPVSSGDLVAKPAILGAMALRVPQVATGLATLSIASPEGLAARAGPAGMGSARSAVPVGSGSDRRGEMAGTPLRAVGSAVWVGRVATVVMQLLETSVQAAPAAPVGTVGMAGTLKAVPADMPFAGEGATAEAQMRPMAVRVAAAEAARANHRARAGPAESPGPSEVRRMARTEQACLANEGRFVMGGTQ